MKRGYKRLLKLADHLESDRRGHDAFCFSKYHEETDCGTVGCALGECPTVWKTWKIMGQIPAIKYDMTALESAAYWFEITERQAEHLFFPRNQNTRSFGGKDLDIHATAHEVADNIRAFVTRKGATKKPKGDG